MLSMQAPDVASRVTLSMRLTETENIHFSLTVQKSLGVRTIVEKKLRSRERCFIEIAVLLYMLGILNLSHGGLLRGSVIY